MIGTVLTVLVLCGVTWPVLSFNGGTGAGHSPRPGRQVSADLARGRKRGQCPAPAPPYTVKSTLLTSFTSILDRSMPILPDSGPTAMPWCPPEQHARTAKRAGKSRPADAVQLQQTLASLRTPANSLRSDHSSGVRTGPARNQRLALLQLASHLPARWQPMSDGGQRFSACPKRLPRSAYVSRPAVSCGGTRHVA